jgi:hypothetical protein
MTSTATGHPHNLEEVLAECVAALQGIAATRLPLPLDRRMLWLSENKEILSEAEREELLAAIEFAEDRTLQKLRAQVLLKRLAELFPNLVARQP